MNPDFIYFKELALDDNNKFVLDFSDEEFIQKINFNKNFNYYIVSLDCNLILKEHIKKDKKKEIKELSQKSRLLLGKGAAYQSDIGFLTTNANKNLFNLPFVDNTYHFILFLHTYILYMIILLAIIFLIPLKKKLETAEFICHSRILRTMGLNFREYYHLQEKRIFQ